MKPIFTTTLLSVAAALLLVGCSEKSPEATPPNAALTEPPAEAKANAYVELSDASFPSFAKDSKVAVVDFWAPWCGPCHRMAPIFSEVASSYQDRASFAKLNVDEAPKTAQSQKITGIPAILIYKDGALADTIVGVVSADHFRARLERHL